MSSADFQLLPEDEGIKLLKEGCKLISEGKAWTKSQLAGIEIFFLMLNTEKGILQVSAPTASGQFERFLRGLRETGVLECFFNATLPKATLFFKSQFIGVEQGRLCFQLPLKIYKIQRRQFLRLPIPDSFSIKADFFLPSVPEQKIFRRVIDLSAGGMGVEITEDDALLLVPEMKLTPIKFLLRTKQIITEGIIKHSRPIPEGQRFRGVKIGIQFESLNSQDLAHIDQYVQTEARRFFTTLD